MRVKCTVTVIPRLNEETAWDNCQEFHADPATAFSTAAPSRGLQSADAKAVFRAITNEPLMRDRSVMRLSVTPSTMFAQASGGAYLINPP